MGEANHSFSQANHMSLIQSNPIVYCMSFAVTFGQGAYDQIAALYKYDVQHHEQ